MACFVCAMANQKIGQNRDKMSQLNLLIETLKAARMN